MIREENCLKGPDRKAVELGWGREEPEMLKRVRRDSWVLELREEREDIRRVREEEEGERESEPWDDWDERADCACVIAQHLQAEEWAEARKQWEVVKETNECAVPFDRGFFWKGVMDE